MNRPERDIVRIGIVGRAHGVRGLVKVKPVTDSPQRFKDLSSVIVESPQGTRQQLKISHVFVHHNEVRLGFEEIGNREEAEELTGSSLNIPIDDVRPLEKDAYYGFEVIGFQVSTVSGRFLGRVEEVMDLPANAVLIVRHEGKEYLIPSIKDVIKEIDKALGKITIEPVEGLLD